MRAVFRRKLGEHLRGPLPLIGHKADRRPADFSRLCLSEKAHQKEYPENPGSHAIPKIRRMSRSRGGPRVARRG